MGIPGWFRPRGFLMGIPGESFAWSGGFGAPSLGCSVPLQEPHGPQRLGVGYVDIQAKWKTKSFTILYHLPTWKKDDIWIETDDETGIHNVAATACTESCDENWLIKHASASTHLWWISRCLNNKPWTLTTMGSNHLWPPRIRPVPRQLPPGPEGGREPRLWPGDAGAPWSSRNRKFPSLPAARVRRVLEINAPLFLGDQVGTFLDL